MDGSCASVVALKTKSAHGTDRSRRNCVVGLQQYSALITRTRSYALHRRHYTLYSNRPACQEKFVTCQAKLALSASKKQQHNFVFFVCCEISSSSKRKTTECVGSLRFYLEIYVKKTYQFTTVCKNDVMISVL